MDHDVEKAEVGVVKGRRIEPAALTSMEFVNGEPLQGYLRRYKHFISVAARNIARATGCMY
eukprot:1385380-Amorphochlora_amoeboformis.AAC.1